MRPYYAAAANTDRDALLPPPLCPARDRILYRIYHTGPPVARRRAGFVERGRENVKFLCARRGKFCTVFTLCGCGLPRFYIDCTGAWSITGLCRDTIEPFRAKGTGAAGWPPSLHKTAVQRRKKGEEITYETYRCDYLRCGYGSEPGCLQHHRQQLFRFHR